VLRVMKRKVFLIAVQIVSVQAVPPITLVIPLAAVATQQTW
jgi:hypothetical protein